MSLYRLGIQILIHYEGLFVDLGGAAFIPEA
jgi:hypothetical protein